MADILHRVGIKATTDQVYQALATPEGVAGWWTRDSRGDTEVGGNLSFRFSAEGVEIGGFQMEILELDPTRRERGEHEAGDEDHRRHPEVQPTAQHRLERCGRFRGGGQVCLVHRQGAHLDTYASVTYASVG